MGIELNTNPNYSCIIVYIYIYIKFMNINFCYAKIIPPLPGGMKFANPPYCKFHTPQGYKICKKNFNKLR